MGAFSTPVVCPVIIGRAPERDALFRLIDRARRGQGRVALVSGEAGVGKSRLLVEAKAYADSQNFLLLQGNCFQLDSTYPYAPLLDLLRSPVAQPLLTTGSRPLIQELTPLLPELVQSPLISPSIPLSDPEQEKRRLFAALTYFFHELTEQRPVLLVFEDLHWCDDISLEFLQSLARLCADHALLLLMTYRSDEVGPGLQRCLAQLDRTRLSQELRLSPLSRIEVADMLAAIFAGNSDDAGEQDNLLDLIYPLTEGNPFFVEEVLSSLASRGVVQTNGEAWRVRLFANRKSETVPVPRSIQDAVQQRIQQLSAEATRVVTFASVAGRRFDFAVLQEVMRCDEQRLLLLLKELVASQLVIEISADQYAFRHALTQQAVYTGLLARERRLLHRLLAQAIEQLYGVAPALDAHLEDLAYHYFEAEVWENAFIYEQRAAEKAMALYAPQVAIEHVTRALIALSHLPGTTSSSLYHLRGRAYETLGEFEHALSDYERGLEESRIAKDLLMEWKNMMAIGFLWTGRDYERAGEWFRRAGDLAESLDDPVLRASSLNRLGNWLTNVGRIQEGLEAHLEALRLFESQQNARIDQSVQGIQNAQGMAETLDLLGVAYGFYGDTVRIVEYLERACAMFRDLGDQQRLASSLASRALDSVPEKIITTYSALRPPDEVVRDVEEALRLTRETNSQTGQAFVEFVTSLVYLSFGEFGLSYSHARESLRIATAIEHREWLAAAHVALGQLYVLMMQPDLAIAALNAGLAEARSLGSDFWTKYLTLYLALAHILKHEYAQAEAILDAVMHVDQQPANVAERQLLWVWGELALAQGRYVEALRMAEQLIVSAPGDSRGQPIPHLLLMKGEALLGLKRVEEAVTTLEEAKRGAELRHAPSIQWRVHRSQGHAYLALKREEQARQAFGAAREIIGQLAQTIEQTALREQFLHAALQTLRSEKSLSPRPMTLEKYEKQEKQERYDGLTGREVEVLRAVAQGLTDAQVAERLVISPRTVHSHLNSIYSKLGITSRSAATRYALEHDLT